jgi:hypothetical protein
MEKGSLMITQAGKDYKNAEAFCNMPYVCNTCHNKEKIWNSRDGGTPFTIPCSFCTKGKMVRFLSAMSGHNETYIPREGQRIFKDPEGPAEAAEEVSNGTVLVDYHNNPVPLSKRRSMLKTIFQTDFTDLENKYGEDVIKSMLQRWQALLTKDLGL